MCGLFLLTLALVVSLGTSKCPDGSLTSAIDSKLCYKLGSNATTWMEAKLQCTSLDGHLVTIDDGFTNVYLNGRIGLASALPTSGDANNETGKLRLTLIGSKKGHFVFLVSR